MPFKISAISLISIWLECKYVLGSGFNLAFFFFLAFKMGLFGKLINAAFQFNAFLKFEGRGFFIVFEVASAKEKRLGFNGLIHHLS